MCCKVDKRNRGLLIKYTGDTHLGGVLGVKWGLAHCTAGFRANCRNRLKFSFTK